MSCFPWFTSRSYLQKQTTGNEDHAQQHFSLIVFGGLSNWSFKKLIHDMAAMIEQDIKQEKDIKTHHVFFFVDIRQEFQKLQLLTTNDDKADSGKYKLHYNDNNFRDALFAANKAFPEFLWVEKAFSNEVVSRLREQMFYVYIPIDSTGPAHSKLANGRLQEIERHVSPTGNWDRIFYASIPPAAFKQFGSTIDEFLRTPPPGNTRLIVEKPYGMNKDQAVNLNEHLEGLFPGQVFRTDHFLAMNCVRWIPFLRFCKTDNEVIQNVQSKWNKECVEKISVRWSTQGDLRDGRAHTYFDKVGVVRDMIQNHIFVMMLVTTMNRPCLPGQSVSSAITAAAAAAAAINASTSTTTSSTPSSPSSSTATTTAAESSVLGQVIVDKASSTATLFDLHSEHKKAIAQCRTDIAAQMSLLKRQSITLGQYDRYATQHGGSEVTPTAFHFTTSVSNAPGNILGGVPIIATGAYATKDRIFDVVLTLKQGQEISYESVAYNTVKINFQTNSMDLVNSVTNTTGAVIKLQNLCKKATQLWEVMGGDKCYFVGSDEVIAAWEFVQEVLEEPQCVQYTQGTTWPDAFRILQTFKPLTQSAQ